MPVRHPVLVLVLPDRQRAAGLSPVAARGREQGETDRLEAYPTQFGSKELVDPHKGRKVFQQIEKKARHQLGKYSKPFPAANAHFVPWDHVPELIDQLQTLKAEFDQPVEGFLTQYPQLRAEWQTQHPDVADAAYPAAWDLRKKFNFGWHTFKVAGAASAMAIDDIQAELAGQQVRAEQLAQMKQNLQAECQQFASDYMMAFRKEVAEFCDQVTDASGKVHNKTLQAIRRKIERFHAMNISNDAGTGSPGGDAWGPDPPRPAPGTLYALLESERRAIVEYALAHPEVRSRIGLENAGRECGRGQSVERVPRPARGEPDLPLEAQDPPRGPAPAGLISVQTWRCPCHFLALWGTVRHAHAIRP
jgi:hypothetical protein